MAHDDFYASAFGGFYSAYMRRPWLARRISRVVWGGDLAPYYGRMSAIGEVEPSQTIVDCPCGAGAAFSLVSPPPGVRYVAVDLSPSMLARAGARAQELGLDDIEFVRGDAAAIPLPDASADLFLSLWGLHCFADPAAAIEDAARVLAPGGRLVGCAFVRGSDSLRQRLLVRPGFGDFGNVATAAEVEDHLASVELAVTALERHGPMLYFDALVPA